MTQVANIAAYFERIGFAGSIAPNLQTLQALHELHPAAIPFENLNPLLGLPVTLDQSELEKKILHARRGGYCFEHNMLFWRVLTELGYSVRAHLGRVLWGRPEGTQSPRSHMVLSVEINSVPYFCDVGFGGLSLTAPLRLRAGIEQQTPHETFRITGDEAEFRLEAKLGDDWRPLYAFDLATMIEPDFEAPNYYAATHPDSGFRHQLRLARAIKGQRMTLVDTVLTTYVTGGESQRQVLDTPQALLDAVTGIFGIEPPAGAGLDALFARILESAEAA